MPNKYRINEKLEPQELHKLITSRRSTAEDDTAAQNKLMDAIATEIVMKAKFVCAVNISPKPTEESDGTYKLDDKAKISFMLLENEKFGKIFPVFTDESELEKCGAFSNYYTIITDFDYISGVIADGGVCEGMMINPFDDNMFISRNAVSKWREKKQILQTGRANHLVTGNTPVDVYTPNPYPLQLSNKLCEIAKDLPEVNALWLRGITLNGDKGYLLVINALQPDRFYDIFGVAGKDFIGKMPLHIVPLNGDLGRKATLNVLPIYSK